MPRAAWGGGLFFAVGETFAFEASLDEVRALSFGAKLLAGGFDTQGLFDGSEAETAGEAVVEDFEVVVFEFEDFTTINTNEVIVGGTVEEVGVVGCLAVTEVDLVEEVGFGEQGEGAVEGGSGGSGALFAKALEEFFRGEVFVGGKDELDDGIALGGLTKALGANEGVEFFANSRRHHIDALICN